ncbi:armadillo-type protein [Phakopsora pachyrhizi]|uniref:Exportin-T n=1 Tax=Phakopsora pachyrhizi TaxID=170000 RepID=A0AAV0BKA9_PHAPC|nr:armadillo-type protein [Phakopsora pachyrhizi]CAH7686777.1 armadillo-type protein [Phakopsora pachyrhizi]
MSTIDEKLNQAVLAALNPGPHQSEGHQFLQQIRQSPKEAWQGGLMCFLAGSPVQEGSQNWTYKYPGETRLFGLQLVDEMLQLSTSSAEEVALVQNCYQTVREQLWDYINREFVQGPGEVGLPYLRNKLVQTIFLLFFQSYPNNWPDFFASLSDLIRKHPTAHSSSDKIDFNPRTTDLYLRLLHEISAELSDALLRLNKPQNRLLRDSELRDAVRENSAARIAEETFAIVAESLRGLSENETQGRVGLRGQVARDCLEMGIRVVEDYVPWIDISLIVTPTWIPLLYQSLRLPQLEIRLAAADSILCIITKGMPSDHRIQLYTLLGLAEVLDALRTEAHSARKSGNWSEEEDQFQERLAKILNGLGFELCKVCDDNSASLETRSNALALATQLLPLLLAFLEEVAFGTCSAVLPFSSSILSRYKKDKKMSPDSHMSPVKRTFLVQLLKRVIEKMRFPVDEILEWMPPLLPGQTEDDDFAAFLDRRRQLKIIVESVASIDESLFQESVDPLISSIFESLSGKASNFSWQEVELATFLLYNYGEAMRASGSMGPWSYVQVPPEELKKSNKNREYKINYPQYPLSSLGSLLLKASKSPLAQFPHPSIPLQWFECVVRYHEFFEMFPSAVQEILPSFLGAWGLHHPSHNVRSRCYYLFYRFVSQSRSVFRSHIAVETLQSVIDQMQDLVLLEAQVPTAHVINAGGPDHDPLAKVIQEPSLFDSQLYLFEAIGIVIASFSKEQLLTAYLAKMTEPLVNGMQFTVPNPPVEVADLNKVLNTYYCIMAIGAIAKGFPNLPSKNTAPTQRPGQWLDIFKNATDAIMRVTRNMNNIRIIREGARLSFHKIVALLGMEALPHVPVLIECLLEKLTKPEIVDFLSFVGQLIYKYKGNFTSLLDRLLIPLFSKIVSFLDQPTAGTDDIVLQSELRRAYFSLFNSIINAQMDLVLISANNRPHLEEILKTIIYQMQAKEVLIPDLKLGFGVLKNFTSTWLKPISTGEPSPVPGFEIFLYNQVIPLLFDVPNQSRFDWSDAESYLVLAEMASLLKMIITARDEEFVQVLMGNFFPSISCPPEKGANLIKSIRETLDAKPSRKPLMEFFGRNGNKQ